jgi:hypothetical protein
MLSAYVQGRWRRSEVNPISGSNLSSRSGSSPKHCLATVSRFGVRSLIGSCSGSHYQTSPLCFGLSLIAVILFHHNSMVPPRFDNHSICFQLFPLRFSLKFVMEITKVYAIAAGGVLLIFISVNLRPYIARSWATAALLTDKYLTYPQLLHRHRFLGPWSPSSIGLQLLYIGVNVLCLWLHVPSIWTAGLRAANLSLINLIPLFAGPHLSFLADLLGITLHMYRRFHRSAGLMSFVLLVLHILTVVAKRTSFPLHNPENLFGLIVSHLVLPSHTDH